MQIDWFTVIAQIINFLILVWLLKRFLYKPILNAIEERENKIASQLEDAESKKEEAQKEQDEFRQKNEDFEHKKKELMKNAVEESEEKRQKLLEEARNEANEFRSQLKKSSEEDQQNLSQEIEQKVQQEVFAITRKTLSDLASLDLEEQTVRVFIRRLNELKEDEKKQFLEAFKSKSDPILVRSAFDLPSKQKTEIQNTIAEILGTETQFQYKTVPELVSGIELTANGFKLAWSISEYLNSLEKNISETIKEKTKTGSEKQ
jgi:F-type H+-transporting ATPase subunit b